MPGATTAGLPFPLPTEPVRDGAQRIRELAESLDQDPIEGEAFRNSAWTLNSNSWTALQWSGEAYAHHGSALTLGPTGYACPLAGRYYCEVTINFPGNSTGRRALGVAAPTGTPSAYNQAMVPAAQPTNLWLKASFTVLCTAGQILTAFAYQDSGVAMSMPANVSLFLVRRLRLGQPHA